MQVDPTLTRADRLVGQVLGQVGELPDVYTELEVGFFLLRRLLGVRTSVRAGVLPHMSMYSLSAFALALTWRAPSHELSFVNLPTITGGCCFWGVALCVQTSSVRMLLTNELLSDMQSGEKQGKVTKLSKNEVLMLNIGSMCTGARVLAVRSCGRRRCPGMSPV